jgi:succinyl-CoA synthetase beta subunit
MVPSSQLVQSAEEIDALGFCVLKAQIPAGSRKKTGGVPFARTLKENIFSQSVTIQQPKRLFSFVALR